MNLFYAILWKTTAYDEPSIRNCFYKKLLAMLTEILSSYINHNHE